MHTTKKLVMIGTILALGGCEYGPTERPGHKEAVRATKAAIDQADAERQAADAKAEEQRKANQAAKDAEEAKPKPYKDEVKTFMTHGDVMKLKGKVECLYLMMFNTGASLDPEGATWDGVSYDAFVAPVIEKALPNGLFKTVKPASDYDDKARAAAHDYVVIYFQAARFRHDWRHTDWAVNDDVGNYGKSDVPELCPTPRAHHKHKGKKAKK